jgi:hypothetical protein
MSIDKFSPFITLSYPTSPFCKQFYQASLFYFCTSVYLPFSVMQLLKSLHGWNQERSSREITHSFHSLCKHSVALIIQPSPVLHFCPRMMMSVETTCRKWTLTSTCYKDAPGHSASQPGPSSQSMQSIMFRRNKGENSHDHVSWGVRRIYKIQYLLMIKTKPKIQMRKLSKDRKAFMNRVYT